MYEVIHKIRSQPEGEVLLGGMICDKKGGLRKRAIALNQFYFIFFLACQQQIVYRCGGGGGASFCDVIFVRGPIKCFACLSMFPNSETYNN